MNNFLNTVQARKQQELEQLQSRFVQQINNTTQALKTDKLTVIAEVKRHSPANGALASIADPVILAKEYVAAGANMISVLTDAAFHASTEDLKQVAAANIGVPILRKDFIINSLQITESKILGADIILLIAALVGEQLKTLLEAANQIGLAVLVEVHDQHELNLAVASGAKIIGINNRNLDTLKVDTAVALDLVKQIPAHIIKVAESGIHDPVLAQQYRQAGFDAVLIGEALVKSEDRKGFIGKCKAQ